MRKLKKYLLTYNDGSVHRVENLRLYASLNGYCYNSLLKLNHGEQLEHGNIVKCEEINVEQEPLDFGCLEVPIVVGSSIDTKQNTVYPDDVDGRIYNRPPIRKNPILPGVRVYFNKRKPPRYVARIKDLDQKTIEIGPFKTAEEAHEAFKKKYKEIRGVEWVL